MHDTFRLRKFRSCPASLLWGCSSGRLKARGVHDALGTALYYLMAGAPFLVANLWDVTDKDIDKLCMAHMERTFAPVSDNATDETGGKRHAAEALAHCRDVCRMPYAVGAAPVFYGIPTALVHG
jgi:separase